MDKVAVTSLLHAHGVPLSEAYDATEGILDGRTVSVTLPAETDVEELRHALDRVGVVV
jgi:hypothetical protein